MLQLSLFDISSLKPFEKPDAVPSAASSRQVSFDPTTFTESRDSKADAVADIFENPKKYEGLDVYADLDVFADMLSGNTASRTRPTVSPVLQESDTVDEDFFRKAGNSDSKYGRG